MNHDTARRVILERAPAADAHPNEGLSEDVGHQIPFTDRELMARITVPLESPPVVEAGGLADPSVVVGSGNEGGGEERLPIIGVSGTEVLQPATGSRPTPLELDESDSESAERVPLTNSFAALSAFSDDGTVEESLALRSCLSSPRRKQQRQ